VVEEEFSGIKDLEMSFPFKHQNVNTYIVPAAAALERPIWVSRFDRYTAFGLALLYPPRRDSRALGPAIKLAKVTYKPLFAPFSGNFSGASFQVFLSSLNLATLSISSLLITSTMALLPLKSLQEAISRQQENAWLILAVV
jgi:hypothetical protein